MRTGADFGAVGRERVGAVRQGSYGGWICGSGGGQVSSRREELLRPQVFG